MNGNNILIRHNFVHIPGSDFVGASQEEHTTIMMNLSYYGYSLSVDAYKALIKLSSNELSSWWKSVEPELKALTGDDRKIGDFVVYKNFPAEVLDKSFADYWFPQILMYWGFPAEFFAQEVEPRENMKDQPSLKVLSRSNTNTFANILKSHLGSPVRWKDYELEEVKYMSNTLPVDISSIPFKENMVAIAKYFIENNRKAVVNTATDVLRLAVGLSDGDISLREKTKFKSFNKPTRKFLLGLLEQSSNLEEDIARRSEVWKKLLSHLHPGDWAKRFPKVCKVADDLYHDRLVTFNSDIEKFLLQKDSSVLDLLVTRPGEYRRRLAHTLSLFGEKSVDKFSSPKVLGKLTTNQLVVLRKHLQTVNSRSYRVFPPKGNWSKLKVSETPRWVENAYVNKLSANISAEINSRLPKIKYLDKMTDKVKLPNGNEVGSYSRGSVFQIPRGTNFIRTASYWKNDPDKGVVWFDNSWNFFDANWKSVGVCCWNAVKFEGKNTNNSKFTYNPFNKESSSKKVPQKNCVGAVFSGDPVNSVEMQGRAAQMIDLYPAELKKLGVRYAVWNILCFSKKTFSEVEDVFAALQWGENPQSGQLFEPSRCQLAFPLKGKQLTKYICLIDLETDELVYLDANLKGHVNSAVSNTEILENTMPAFMEYVNTLPSVYDLFQDMVDPDGEIQVIYSDKNIDLTENTSAYIFKAENKKNKINPVDLNSFLA